MSLGKPRVRSSRRIALTISILFHLIVAVILVFEFVRQATREIPPDDSMAVEFLKPEAKKQVLRRRINPIRHEVQNMQIRYTAVDTTLQLVTTASSVPGGYEQPIASPTSVVGGTFGGSIPITKSVKSLTNAMTFDAATDSPKPPTVRLTPITSGFESARVYSVATDLVSPTMHANGETRAVEFRLRVKPTYPASARRAEKEGLVVLEAEVAEDGSVEAVSILQGVGFGLEDAAIRALRASRFAPAMRDGKPIRVTVRVPYRFRLEDAT